RTEEIRDPASVRLGRLGAVIQSLGPNVLFLNEVACDMPGGPGASQGNSACTNAQRFADTFLAQSRDPAIKPIRYKAFMAPVNTGVPSGFDLDHDGVVARTYPGAPVARPDATGDAGRAYGNDCWGFGTFPGQYGMALLV